MVERKKTVTLERSHIYLLYEGEMLVTSSQYKVETSKGCILNSELINCFTGGLAEEGRVSAYATTDAIIITTEM